MIDEERFFVACLYDEKNDGIARIIQLLPSEGDEDGLFVLIEGRGADESNGTEKVFCFSYG